MTARRSIFSQKAHSNLESSFSHRPPSILPVIIHPHPSKPEASFSYWLLTVQSIHTIHSWPDHAAKNEERTAGCSFVTRCTPTPRRIGPPGCPHRTTIRDPSRTMKRNRAISLQVRLLRLTRQGNGPNNLPKKI